MGKYHPSHHVNEWIRYILYGFNFLLWVLSVFILLVGIVGIAIREDKLSITSYVDFLTDPAAILVAIGALVFVVTFFGCVGALNENCLFLRIYFVLLIIIFVLEIICGILAFAFSSQLEAEVNDVIREGIRQYRNDADLTNFIDFAQRELECCGGDGRLKDWSYNDYFNCSNGELNNLTNIEACGVPYSCCVGSDGEVINTQCGLVGDTHSGQNTLFEDQVNVFWTDGCVEKLQQELRMRSYIIGFAVFGIAALQLIGIFMAIELNRELVKERKRYTGHSDLPVN